MQEYSLLDKQKFDKIFGNKSSPSQIEKDYRQKTIKYIKYIKWIPGIKMIGVGNSLAMNSATIKSDIDLLIVTDDKRMWLVRILCTLIFQILGVRKNKKKHAGRFCLSFFCTLKGLNFGTFALEKDPYLYFWILSFKPILSYDNTYNLFLEKNKSWANLSSFKNILETNKKHIHYKKRKKDFSFPLRILDFINAFFKKLFLPKTLKNYERIGKPFGVIIDDEMLKFHNGDIRKEIAKEFTEKRK